MFYGYRNLPGNVVNFMSLFQVVLTSLGTYLVLGEKLDRNEWIGIALAIVLLSLFIFI